MYSVKYGGKRGKTIKLVESPDLVAIRTKDNQDLESMNVSRESREMLNDSTQVAAFPEAGITVRKMNAPNELEATSMRDQTRTALKKEEDIRFAGRVLQDEKSGEVMLYTENFFVKFKDAITETDCLALLEKYHLKIKDKLVFATNSYFVQAVEGTGLAVFEMAAQILQEKDVEFCHPEIVQERRFKSIHPLQWHLQKTVIGGKVIDQHVNIEKAWAISRGKGITIAVVDDGVDMAHPEFEGRIVHPRDVTASSDNANPVEADDNHGTACAGMACAAGLEGGASGTAPEANLMPIRLRSGLGSMAEANAFVWAAEHGADVISCSWGPTDGDWWNPNDPTHKRYTALPDSTRLAMDYALTKGRGGKGCVILFAAGNGNEVTKNDGYASYPGVIAVSACNDTGKRSVYSDYGKSICVSFPSGDYAWKPFKHPAAISDGLRTTDRAQGPGYIPENYVNSFGGTSGACPGMAGVVGLMLAANPNLGPADVQNIIRQSCMAIDTAEGEYDSDKHSIYYGYGRINAGLAVENAQKGKQEAAISVEGTIKFSTVGEKKLTPGEWVGNFDPPKKVIGFSLRLQAAENGMRLRYRANVAGSGIVENTNEGDYVGASSGRKRLIGFALELQGSAASDYELEYAARIKDNANLLRAKNGAFCGTDKMDGGTIEAISVLLRKKIG